MLKGINHSVIEVNDTGNEYYERAILMIRPEYASAQRSCKNACAKENTDQYASCHIGGCHRLYNINADKVKADI